MERWVRRWRRRGWEGGLMVGASAWGQMAEERLADRAGNGHADKRTHGWRVGQRMGSRARQVLLVLHQGSSQPPRNTQSKGNGSPAGQHLRRSLRRGEQREKHRPRESQTGPRSQPSGAATCCLTTEQGLRLCEPHLPRLFNEKHHVPPTGCYGMKFTSIYRGQPETWYSQR